MTLLFISIIVILAVLITGVLFIHKFTDTSPMYRNEALANLIDNKLPQTQCGDCGFPGCRPYAQAIVAGETDINRCPPGGTETINAIATVLGRQSMPLEEVTVRDTSPLVASIDEQLCIGCVKCIRACPVDAILGAAGQMHTVMPKVCTGCRLCVEPCPVDCIEIIPAETKIKKFVWDKPGRIPGGIAYEPPAI